MRSRSTRCTRAGWTTTAGPAPGPPGTARPLVGNTDLHRLDQIGTTWSEVDAPADADAICAAIRAGHVVVRSEPISWPRAVWTMARMELGGLGRRHLRRPPMPQRVYATEAQRQEGPLKRVA